MEDAMRDSSENKIFLKVAKEKITFLIKIIEACDNLGVVSTVNAQEGKVLIHVTLDTRAEVLDIIKHLPFVELEKNLY